MQENQLQREGSSKAQQQRERQPKAQQQGERQSKTQQQGERQSKTQQQGERQSKAQQQRETLKIGKDQYIKLGKLVLITFLVYFGLRYLLPLVVPFFIAYVLSSLIKRPTAYFVRRLHWKPAAAGSILLLLFVSLTGGLLIYAANTLFNQAVLLIGQYPLLKERWVASVDQLCCFCDSFFGIPDGGTMRIVEKGGEKLGTIVTQEVLPSLTKKTIEAAISVTEITAAILITLVATILFLTDMIRKESGQCVSENISPGHGMQTEGVWEQLRETLSNAGIAYFKTQLTIFLIISCICSIGFLFLKNPYALLLGVGIGIFDAFPILGSGLILVPWAIVNFFQRDFYEGAILITVYVLCQIVREYWEPKLLGGKMGMKPVYSLMAIYAGYQLFGFFGIFLGPIGLAILRSLLEITL